LGVRNKAAFYARSFSGREALILPYILVGAQGLEHASGIRAPVRCNTEVLSLRDSEDGRSMEVATARRDIRAKNVVVATGPFQAPKLVVRQAVIRA